MQPHIIESREEPGLFGIKIGDIESFNDGDVANAIVTMELIDKSSHSQKTYLDIGVDQGWWTSLCLALDPSGSFIAIEPNPISVANLATRFAGTPVHLIPKAASDQNGTIRLDLQGGNSHSRGEEGVIVETISIASVLEPLERVTLLKLDTEGHELVILRGCKPFWSKIEAIIFEFTIYWYDKEEGLRVLQDLLAEFPHLYILSRRGRPLLYGPITQDNMLEYIDAFIFAHLQVDIVACRQVPSLLPVCEMI